MTFSTSQLRQLRAPIRPEVVKQREVERFSIIWRVGISSRRRTGSSAMMAGIERHSKANAFGKSR